MAGNLPSCGEILRLQEIFEISHKEINGKAIRVIGKLTSHDFVKGQAVITSAERANHQSRLVLDTKLIEPFDARLGSIFQFIGELDTDLTEELVLHARVVQCVDGLDIALYYSALELQREYLKSSRNKEDFSAKTDLK